MRKTGLVGWAVVQVGVHLLESALGLSEEVVDYTLAELALVFVVVHLEDLVVGALLVACSLHDSWLFIRLRGPH
jgi:hypothetical protein